MQTETEENKYIEALRIKELKLTAENLLHIMRPDAEEILLRHGMEQPPSQSLRAQNVTNEINQEIKDMVKAKSGLCPDLKQLFHDRDMLKNFLAVHRTVWILEGKPV